MKKLVIIKREGKKKDVVNVELNLEESKIQLIQLLIPIGIQAVQDCLQEEVVKLAGARYSHDKNIDNVRWGTNPGSAYLGDQKVEIKVPRVKNLTTDNFVTLENYKKFQAEQIINDLALKRVLNGISCNNYKEASINTAETFGISKSSISKKFINASAKQLESFENRDLREHDIVAIIIDGKRLGNTDMLLALGITLTGRKIFLGFIETSTENEKVCKDLLLKLKDRGLNTNKDVLFLIDGAKGIHKAIKSVFREFGHIQRCQWHKRENVKAYLNKTDQKKYSKKVREAYLEKDYNKAKSEIESIANEVGYINISAKKSLLEGLSEILTLHKLNLAGTELYRSLKTTNCIESVNSQIGSKLDKVDYWKNSSQRQRWFASSLLSIEPNLSLVRGRMWLKTLRENMIKNRLKTKETEAEKENNLVVKEAA